MAELAAHWRLDHDMSWAEIGRRMNRPVDKKSDFRQKVEGILARWGHMEAIDG